MGYYSQVGYVVQGKKEVMVPLIMTFRLSYPDIAAAKQVLDKCTFACTGDILTIKFSSSSTKWYDGFSDVQAHTEFFKMFRSNDEDEDEAEKNISGCFIRLGEDDEDSETYRYGPECYDLVRLVRSIEFEVNAEGKINEALG